MQDSQEVLDARFHLSTVTMETSSAAAQWFPSENRKQFQNRVRTRQVTAVLFGFCSWSRWTHQSTRDQNPTESTNKTNRTATRQNQVLIQIVWIREDQQPVRLHPGFGSVLVRCRCAAGSPQLGGSDARSLEQNKTQSGSGPEHNQNQQLRFSRTESLSARARLHADLLNGERRQPIRERLRAARGDSWLLRSPSAARARARALGSFREESIMGALVITMTLQQDTAGQERYRTITTAYYRGAMGFILMYDITNEESFNAVQDWATQIKTYSWDNAQVIMVGNKCDMDEERVVPPEKGKHLADQLGFEYYEASAKENINVRQVFERLVDIICVKMSERVDVEAPVAPGSKTTRLTDKPAQLPQKCC
ncbi:hypothetical protein CCH79_00020287 [Gambusia affinis]|uniref:small monomeric GTPase n=1 Tax=Gambusia affinis TaxID=33528 RepID=A0A315VCY4_GAMAF|nr:hypothetical protein CCH79_00020287 [Gambusia affinis]